MSEEWDAKTVIGSKRQTPKVTKKDSDLNGTWNKALLFVIYLNFFCSCMYPFSNTLECNFDWSV